MESQRSRMAKAILKAESPPQSGDSHFSVRTRPRGYETCRSVGPSGGPEVSPGGFYGDLGFNRPAEPFAWGKGQTFNPMALEQLDIQIQRKKELRFLAHTIHTNLS